MNNSPFYSSLNILLDNIEGSHLLLEYYAEFNREIFRARDFKTVINTCYRQLRRIYGSQHIEFVLWHKRTRLVKFIYSEQNDRIVPGAEFSERGTLYNYVLEKQQAVLTNEYSRFCSNLGADTAGIKAASWLGLPMVVRGKVLGMVVIWDEHPERYLRLQDKQFVTTLIGMVSFAIENIYLYSHIVDKNGSFSFSDKIIPPISHQNSLKDLLKQLLESAFQQPDAAYAGVFLRSRHHRKWRTLCEKYEKPSFSVLGVSLLKGFARMPESIIRQGDYQFWNTSLHSHPLKPVFAESFQELKIRSTLLVPFEVNNIYYGLLMVAFHSREDEPGRDLIQMIRFIAYLTRQLIEKQILLEHKSKHENYIRQLESLKFIGEQASGAVHHLNNILSVILGKSQILQKKIDDVRLRRDLRIMEQAAADGAKTVNRIRSARSGSKKEISRKVLNLNDLVQEVVEIARPRLEIEAQARGIEYQLDLQQGKIKPVYGDATALREALLNLINNALDAMPSGGRLKVRTSMKENDILLYISDTGMGIPESVQEKIFEPFFTTKGKNGNGLGLSIVADIVSSHSGKIYVDSVLNKGTTFLMELPSAEEKEAEPLEEDFRPEAVSYKLLLVDDDGFVRETLAELLEEENFDVIRASSAQDALLKFQKYRCEVVLTDLSMPGVNGYELARQIKQLKPQVPVFLITGWNQVNPQRVSSHEAVDGVIEKPFNVHQFRRKLKDYWSPNGKDKNL
ncbi:MAG: ATP-binding protein [Calditrichia bacterium]